MLTKNGLHNIFNDFSQLKVLIIGDVMIDSYIWGNVKRLSPEAPVPIVNVVKREYRPGGAANVAKNIKSLGAEPIICAYIGDDDKGTLFCDLLKQEGITDSGILKSSDRITTVKFRVIGNNAQLLRVDEETEKEISHEEVNALFLNIENFLRTEKIDVVVFEDYDKGTITSGLISKVIDLAKDHGIPVVVDPKKNNFFNYKNVDFFKPNLKELSEGLKTDINPNDKKQIAELVTKFQTEQHIQTVLVSLSEYGVFISEKSEQVVVNNLIPAHTRNIADVSGAGDTLISMAALCIALKLDAQTTARLSNLAGGIVCEYVGVVPIDKEKLYNEAVRLLTV